MKAKITALKLENVKRIKLVEFQPNTDGLTIIGGNNGEGKTSVLDAIAYALGGEAFRPSALTNSDGNAYIKVEVGEYTVERSGKNATLKITDRRGMKGGQKMLDEIIGKFALDLSGFMNSNDKTKADLLLKMFPELADALLMLQKKEKDIRDRRADVNRDIKRIQYQFDTMPKGEGAPPSEISILTLSQELQDAMEYNAERERKINRIESEKKKLSDLENEYDNIITEGNAIAEKIKALEAELKKNELREEAIAQEGEEIKNAIGCMLSDLKAMPPMPLDEIKQKITSADQLNQLVRQKEEAGKVYENIQELKSQSDRMTKNLEEIDTERIRLLKNANLPLPELSINADGELLYKNQKWDCMSGAERLKVATAICMEAKPSCGFVLIDGLEAMDEKTLDDFGTYLAEKNMQGIGTIVGKNERASIILEDGRILNNQ